MEFYRIQDVDVSELTLGEGRTHPDGYCKVIPIKYAYDTPFQVLFQDLRVHPFSVSNFPGQRFRKLSLYADNGSEKAFLLTVEQRLQTLLNELDQSTESVKIWCNERDRFEVVLSPHVTKSVGGTTIEHNRFRFTLRNGITNELMSDVVPSHEDLKRVFKYDDQLVAILRFESMIMSAHKTTIRITLFQGKLYPKASLHELPVGHRYYKPPPGLFTIEDLLTDTVIAGVTNNNLGSFHSDADTDDTDMTIDTPVQSTDAPSALCSVCMVTSINRLLNCGHTLCVSCAQQVLHCPHCRTVITERRPMYLA